MYIYIISTCIVPFIIWPATNSLAFPSRFLKMFHLKPIQTICMETSWLFTDFRIKFIKIQYIWKKLFTFLYWKWDHFIPPHMCMLSHTFLYTKQCCHQLLYIISGFLCTRSAIVVYIMLVCYCVYNPTQRPVGDGDGDGQPGWRKHS